MGNRQSWGRTEQPEPKHFRVYRVESDTRLTYIAQYSTEEDAEACAKTNAADFGHHYLVVRVIGTAKPPEAPKAVFVRV